MTLPITLDHDRVSFGDRLFVRFERTLRIPDDGRTYPLPPSFGAFPVKRVDDYLDAVPDAWRAQGGVFLPVHAREAMWLSFHGSASALRVAVGKVCALTGDAYEEGLSRTKQNYLVAPKQPWLDGICVKKGLIRQFVAVPLGPGATVEGQVTGEEKVGGVQLVAYAPKPGRLVEPEATRGGAFGSLFAAMACESECPPMSAAVSPSLGRAARAMPASAMGIGAGGSMQQSIYADAHGVDVWDEENYGRCFVHLVSAEDYARITSESAPASPVNAKAYASAGFPWYALDDHHVPALEGSSVLAGVQSVQQLVPAANPADDAPVEPGSVKTLANKLASFVRDGTW